MDFEEDQLLKFKSWKNWKWLLRNLVLVPVEDQRITSKKEKFSCLSETIKSLEEYGGQIMVLNLSPNNVSSSAKNFIRKRKFLLILDEEVYEYAKKIIYIQTERR